MSDFKQFLASKGVQVFSLFFYVIFSTTNHDLALGQQNVETSYFHFQVEFGGGALRCGEYVTIRKVGDASQKVTAFDNIIQVFFILLAK